MRGPKGPVRGGVTRCGCPPPHCRGRGRGKTSRLRTPSSSLLSGSCQLDILLNGVIVSRRHAKRISTKSKMVSRCCHVKFPECQRVIIERTATNVPLNVTGSREKTVKQINMKDTQTETGDVGNEVGKDRVTGITQAAPWLKEFWEKSIRLGSPRVFFFWDLYAHSAVSQVAKRSLALRNTAPEPSRRGTGFYVVSKPDRRTPLRLIMAYHTRHHLSVLCVICHRLHRHHGAAPSSRTQCRRSVRNDCRNRTRVYRDKDAFISRDWHRYWSTRAKTAYI